MLNGCKGVNDQLRSCSWLFYYGGRMRRLDVRIGEHIGVSPLTIKRVRPCGFLKVWTKLSFWQGDWALGYHSLEFGQFSDIS